MGTKHVDTYSKMSPAVFMETKTWLKLQEPVSAKTKLMVTPNRNHGNCR